MNRRWLIGIAAMMFVHPMPPPSYRWWPNCASGDLVVMSSYGYWVCDCPHEVEQPPIRLNLKDGRFE